MSEQRKRLKLSNAQEIRKALARVANMVLNNELDPKQANCIVATCNIILSAIKLQNCKNSDIESEDSMKTNRQYTIQSLLRMAEITDDENKRYEWLAEVEKLVFKNISKDIVEKVMGT